MRISSWAAAVGAGNQARNPVVVAACQSVDKAARAPRTLMVTLRVEGVNGPAQCRRAPRGHAGEIAVDFVAARPYSSNSTPLLDSSNAP